MAGVAALAANHRPSATRFTGLSEERRSAKTHQTMQVRAQIDTIQGEMPLASREYKEVVKLLIRPLGCM